MFSRKNPSTEQQITTRLTGGQVVVLVAVTIPMAVVGIAGAVATYANMTRILKDDATAMGMVAAGEGATLIAALVSLAVTLMGQHTPTVTRVAMWVLPIVASIVGVALAPTQTEKIVMGVTPLAMTVAGEGVAFVARRVVARRTGVDLEQQRRAGLLVWHTNRAQNGGAIGRRLSKAAVWRLTREFATTDPQTVALVAETIRLRVTQGADENLSAVLTRTAVQPSDGPAALPVAETSVALPKPAQAPVTPRETAPQHIEQDDAGWMDVSAADAEDDTERAPVTKADEDDWIHSLMAETEARVATDTKVRLMTTAEVAQLKGVGQGTVRSWKQRGRLTPFEIVDGRPLYHPNDVAKMD